MGIRDADRRGDIVIEDTLDSLYMELQKSNKKLMNLRNLMAETESKVIAELSWQRYLKHKILTKERVN